MNKTIPQIVSLVPEEKRLLNKITFGFGHGNDKIIRESCAAAAPLANSLLARNVIPDIRILFLQDLNSTLGHKGHGKRYSNLIEQLARPSLVTLIS